MRIPDILVQVFKRRKIEMLGRAGIQYRRDKNTYYIDSECLEGNPDVVIYSENVWLGEDSTGVAVEEDFKKVILKEVKQKLEMDNLRVEVYPLIKM